MLLGLIEQVRPDVGEIAMERPTAPANPFRALAVIVDVEPAPVDVTEDGFALRV